MIDHKSIILLLSLFLFWPDQSSCSIYAIDIFKNEKGIAKQRYAPRDTIPIGVLVEKITDINISYSNKNKFVQEAIAQFDENAIAVIKETNDVVVEIIEVDDFFTKLKLNQFGNANHFVVRKESFFRIELKYISPPVDDNNYFSISGHVINRNAKVIPNATIVVKTNGFKDIKTRSDTKGYFEFPLDRDRSHNVDFEVYHPNYSILIDTLILSSKTSYEIVLRKIDRSHFIYMGVGSSLTGLSIYLFANRKNLTNDLDDQRSLRNTGLIGMSTGIILFTYGYLRGSDARAVRKENKRVGVFISDNSLGLRYMF